MNAAQLQQKQSLLAYIETLQDAKQIGAITSYVQQLAKGGTTKLPDAVWEEIRLGEEEIAQGQTHTWAEVEAAMQRGIETGATKRAAKNA